MFGTVICESCSEEGFWRSLVEPWSGKCRETHDSGASAIVESNVRLAAMRAFNETNLCKKLYAAFDSEPIITMLRKFIKVPIEDFCVRTKAHDGRFHVLHAARR